MTKKNTTPLESAEQAYLVGSFRAEFPDYAIVASMNGAHLKGGAVQAKALTNQGMAKGFPDLQIPVPAHGYHGMFIELKRLKGNTPSKEQREWLDFLNDHGYYAVWHRGHKAAFDDILWYMKGVVG